MASVQNSFNIFAIGVQNVYNVVCISIGGSSKNVDFIVLADDLKELQAIWTDVKAKLLKISIFHIS